MKIFGWFIFIFLFSMSIFLAGCAPPPGGQLPSSVASLLDTALSNWNTNYGNEVQATGYTYAGTIDSASERNDILDTMTSPTKAYLPLIDIDNPSTATALLLQDANDVTAQMINSWETTLNTLIQQGMHIITINWTKGANTFTTTCIADNTTIVYDNMLSNAVLVSNVSKKNCLNYTIEWLWGTERGKILADLNCVCMEGHPISCPYTCSAYMTIGDAQINCTTTMDELCCYLNYSWAWGTPLVSISVEVDGFSLKTSGIGSSGNGSGSCFCCCEN